MKNIKVKSDPIWEFLADAIRISESQTNVIAASHPKSKAALERHHLNDVIGRLTQMLFLDARRTNTWLKDQTPTTKRAAIFARQTCGRATKALRHAHTIIITKRPIKSLNPTSS